MILLFDLFRRRLAYYWANKIIVMCPREKNRITALGFNPDKIFICPRGVDTHYFTPKGVKDRKRDKFIVLYIGRKSFEKGYDIVMESAELLEEYPSIHFEFVGDFEKSTVKNITFRGAVHPDNLPEIYSTCDVVVLPSRNEGLPQVLVEAMSMGRPTIISKTLFSDFIPSDTTLFCESSPQSLADSIKYLWENPAITHQIGKSARKFVVNNYRKEFFMQRYREILLS